MSECLAKGRYDYWKDDTQQPVVEPWQLLKDANRLTLSGQRIVDGVTLLDVLATYQSGLCNSMMLNWQSTSNEPAQTWRYWLLENELHYRPPHSDVDQIFSLRSGSLLFPLIRPAAGPLVRQLAQGETQVVLPCLRDPSDTQNFLHPITSARQTVATKSSAENELQHFRYFGGEYGKTGADYWLNSDQLLDRYLWESNAGRWEVRLTDYCRSADFTGF